MPGSDSTLPGLHFISWGAVGYVFHVSDRIVLKYARTPAHSRIKQEHDVFDMLEKAPCPHIIRSFWRLPDINFMENAIGGNLEARLRSRQIRANHEFVEVHTFEQTSLVSRWMMELASAAAWLERLGLAHGDIRPSNLLLNAGDHLKLADFDCAGKIGQQELEAGAPPYARVQGTEAGEDRGTFGLLGPRTEQFAMGSVFYYMTRGHEPYEDKQLSGPEIVDLLQSMQFPVTNPNDTKDSIISRCWHGDFASVQQLATEIGSPQVDRQEFSSDVLERRTQECREWYNTWKPSVDKCMAQIRAQLPCTKEDA